MTELKLIKRKISPQSKVGPGFFERAESDSLKEFFRGGVYHLKLR